LWSAPAWLIWYLVATNYEKLAAEWPRWMAKIRPGRAQTEAIREAQLSNPSAVQSSENGGI
jgi:hypothetical protein